MTLQERVEQLKRCREHQQNALHFWNSEYVRNPTGAIGQCRSQAWEMLGLVTAELEEMSGAVRFQHPVIPPITGQGPPEAWQQPPQD